MAKINIISGIQLSNNPRVVKEADALTEAGHEVAVFSSILNPVDAPLETALSKNKDWTLIPVIDNSIQSFWQRLRWFGARFRCRVWNKIYTASGWGNVRQLGYVGPELLELCRRRKADLNIVHLEQALWVGHQLLKEGERVAIDLEDWYSEDLSSKIENPDLVTCFAAGKNGFFRVVATPPPHRTCWAQHYRRLINALPLKLYTTPFLNMNAIRSMEKPSTVPIAKRPRSFGFLKR